LRWSRTFTRGFSIHGPRPRKGRNSTPDSAAPFEWDIPLLDGYEHEFVPNVSAHPSPERRDGVVNPALIPAIEAWGADAVLVYGWNLSSHLRAMRHFKGRIPVLFRGDSTLLDPQPAWRSIPAPRRAHLGVPAHRRRHRGGTQQRRLLPLVRHSRKPHRRWRRIPSTTRGFPMARALPMHRPCAGGPS
jgi:hypothetical protein